MIVAQIVFWSADDKVKKIDFFNWCAAIPKYHPINRAVLYIREQGITCNIIPIKSKTKNCDWDLTLETSVQGKILYKTCKTFTCGRKTGFSDVDSWLSQNFEIVKKLMNSKIEQYNFLTMSTLKEMAAVSKSLTGLPVDVWCSPRMHSADVRIKVTTGKKTNFSTTVFVRDNKTQGVTLPPATLDLVHRWIFLTGEKKIQHLIGINTKFKIIMRELVVRKRRDNPCKFDVWLGYDEYINGKKTGKIVLGWYIDEYGILIYNYAQEPPETRILRLEQQYVGYLTEEDFQKQEENIIDEEY